MDRRSAFDKIEHVLRGGRPTTQYSIPFHQGMIDRMLTSYHKYGDVELAFQKGIDFLESAKQRVEKYQEDGNTEWLMDAANYMMMEYMFPSHEAAHYDPTSLSPGRRTKTGRITDKHSEDLA